MTPINGPDMLAFIGLIWCLVTGWKAIRRYRELRGRRRMIERASWPGQEDYYRRLRLAAEQEAARQAGDKP